MNVTATTSTPRLINKSRNFVVLIEFHTGTAVALHWCLGGLSADSYICVREMSRRNVYSASRHVQFAKAVWPRRSCAGPCVVRVFRQQRKRAHDGDDVCFTAAATGAACGVETGETSTGQA